MPQFNTVYTPEVALSNVAANTTGQNTYIAGDVFPNLDQAQYRGKIYRFDPGENIRRVRDTTRAPGTQAKPFEFDVEKEITFQCDDHALRIVQPFEIEVGADPAVRQLLAGQQVNVLVDALLLDKEIKAVAALDAALTSAQTSSPSTAWTPAANGTPISDIKDLIETVKTASGVRPDTLAVDSRVISSITETGDFRDRVKHTVLQSGGIMELADMVRRVCGLRFIHVAEVAVQNTAANGATPVMADIWGQRAILYKSQPTPSLFYAGLGLSIRWNSGDMAPGGRGGVAGGFRVMSKFDDDHESFVYKVGSFYDQKVINPKAAHRLTDVLGG